MLQSGLNKSMLLAFNKNEKALHENMFKRKSILMVDEVETPREVPEPGQPDPRISHIKIEHNKTTNMSYICFDKEYFDDMEQYDVDDMVYQLYNQGEFDNTAQYSIDIPQENGTILEINVDVNSEDFTEEKEAEEEEKAKSGASSEEAKSAANKTSKASHKPTKASVETKSEAEMQKNSRYTTSNASFQKNATKSQSGVFGGHHKDKEIVNKDLKKIAEVEGILEHAIKGDDGGKSKTITPSKCLNMKAVITENSEKEYITKHGEEGKTIKINMVVDRSGSMNGRPTKESNILISALNNLAIEYEEMDIKILFSESSNFFGIDLPVDNINSKKLWKYDGTGGAEGLSRTINANWDRIKEGDVNLCYTDGSIMDEALDKSHMKSQEVEFVGMYVNRDFTEAEVMKHYEKNAKYFTHVIIRDNMKSLVNELANRIFLSKHGY